MIDNFLRTNINGNTTAYGTFPKYIDHGFGQVEPNHLSAQRTAQSYAQLPAAASIKVLHQGQFVKYDYANGEVNFTGPGEWMLVYNEIKLYRDGQNDCEFAMIKDNYQARVYSPYGVGEADKQSRFYNGGNYTFGNPKYTKATTYNGFDTYYTKSGDTYTKVTIDAATFNAGQAANPKVDYYTMTGAYSMDDVTAGPDYYEPRYNEDPYHILGVYREQMMKDGTTMVPRVFKTNIGDIFTTNTIDETEVKVGDIFGVKAATGFLVNANGATPGIGQNDTMRWQAVKVYTMPDGQPGVKLMRIA